MDKATSSTRETIVGAESYRKLGCPGGTYTSQSLETRSPHRETYLGWSCLMNCCHVKNSPNRERALK